MSELKAWREVDMTALERELFAAARSERMPAELASRVSSALSASAASSSVAAQGGLLFGKSGLWGVLSLIVLAGAGVFYASTSAPRAPAPAARPRPAVVAQPALVEPATSVAPPAEVSTAPAAQPAATHDPDTLRKEISLLDRARVALDRGATSAALGLLDQHRARFAQATLAPEAEALRIEALAQRGDTEQARTRLRRFQSAHPAHPMSERLRALASEAPSATR